MRWRSALILLALLLSYACEKAPAVDHYAIAKDMESKLTTVGDYSQPGYNQVAEELQLVDEDSPSYADAQAWLKQIQKGRQDALFGRDRAPEVEEGGFHPSADPEPRGGGGGQQQAGSWTAAGWLPYNDVKVGGSGGSAGTASARTASAGQTSSKGCKTGPVILYGTSWCSVCAEARSYFRSHGVSFVDKDVEKDAGAMAEMKRKAPAATSYPVLDLGGEIMPGFSAQAVERKLCL